MPDLSMLRRAKSQDLAAVVTAAGAAGDSLQVCRPVKLTSIDWERHHGF